MTNIASFVAVSFLCICQKIFIQTSGSMKTTFHEICPVCHRESYLEKIDLKYIEAFKAFDEYAYTYILTPITLVYEDP